MGAVANTPDTAQRHPESPRECREALDCGGSTPLLARTGGRERSVECGAALDELGHSTLLLRAKEKRRRAAALQRLSPRSTAPADPRLAKLRIPEQKARVKDGHTTKSESSFGKKLWCVLIVVFLGGIGWQVWKLNAYNNAVRQAKEAKFYWRCDDAISLIRKDWRNALKKETWGEHPRELDMGEVPDLGRHREMLHHLNPTELRAWDVRTKTWVP